MTTTKASLRIESPAKINLFLHVTGKRPDGYHNLISLMCRVSLCDHLYLDIGGKGIRITCPHPTVPEDHRNLVYQAVALFVDSVNDHVRKQLPGLAIHIDKWIPVGAGLGGGSSNAASVLLALNRYFDNPIPTDRLMVLAASIGADVPFFIFQKPAIATGIGEHLEAFENLPAYHVVLVFPGFNVSTAAVFKKLNLRLTNREKKLKQIHFREKNLNLLDALHNDLETVTVADHPSIAEAKSELCRIGALGALMTGSGPTVFGLFANEDKAKKAVKILTDKSGWQIFSARLVV